jgi:hypothetical protein
LDVRDDDKDISESRITLIGIYVMMAAVGVILLGGILPASGGADTGW